MRALALSLVAVGLLSPPARAQTASEPTPPPLPGAESPPTSGDEWAPLPEAEGAREPSGADHPEASSLAPSADPPSQWQGAPIRPTDPRSSTSPDATEPAPPVDRSSEWQGAPLPRPPPPSAASLIEPKFEHYGWRFLFLDPAAIALFTWGVFTGDVGAVVGGLASHLVLGPLIHFFSGEVGNAGWSFMARLSTVPTVLLIFASLNLSSSVACRTEVSCRNLAYGLVTTGLFFGWMYDVLNAERAPSEAMRLWSAAPALGATDRGDATWGLAVRF